MVIVCSKPAFYHDSTDITDPEQRRIASHRLIAKMPTIAAMAYKYSMGQPFVYPRNELSYAENFLRCSGDGVQIRRPVFVLHGIKDNRQIFACLPATDVAWD